MRQNGIDLTPGAPWGSHICQFYRTKEDLLDILVPYFRQGLQDNELCRWITAAPLSVDDARTALRSVVPDLDERLTKGQIEILSHSEWYTKAGKFEATEAIQNCTTQYYRAQQGGYEGLRLSGNSSWLQKTDWQSFMDYEELANDFIGSNRIKALCSYSLDRCLTSEIIQVSIKHQASMVWQDPGWKIVESSKYKKAEQALRASEARYHSLFESMTEGFALHEIITDEHGEPCDYRFLDMNPAFERLTGLKRADFLGKRVRETLPGIRSYWIQKYGHVALTGEPFRTEDYSQAMGRWMEVFAYRPAPNRFAVIFTDITARKQAEEALRNSRTAALNLMQESLEARMEAESISNELRQKEDLLMQVQAIAHLGSWDLDVLSGHLTCSDEMYRILGLHPREVGTTYDTLRELVHPDDTAAVAAAYAASLRDHLDTCEIEYRIVQKNTGVVRTVHEKCHHLRDATGRTIQSIGVVHDITERKRIERRIEYLARFPAEDPNPVLRVLADGTLKYANAAAISALANLNIEPGAKVPEPWRERISDALKRDLPLDYETEIGKDTFSFCIAPIPGKGYANLYGKQITELKQAHEREKLTDMLLAASRTALDTIEAMEEGVALVDMDGKVRSVNRTLTRLTGYRKEQLEGQNLSDLLPILVDPADLSLVQHAFKIALRGAVPKLKEIAMISSTNNRIPIIPSVAFIKDHSGKPATIILTIQDITEHKQTEQQNQIVTALLALFAKKATRKEYLDAVMQVVRQWSGCRCIGIRVLNENGEAPYESQVGFSDEFLAGHCNLVVEKDPCICSRIIAGQPGQHALPCLTRGGSFLCKNTSDFVKSLSAKEKKQFKGVCIKSGFTSVAITPVRYHDSVKAAINFADTRKGAISEEMIAFAESNLSPLIGEAIYRFNVEQSLRQASAYNRSLIDSNPDPMFAINEQGRIIDVNTASENVTGISRNALIGTDFADLVTDSDLARASYMQVLNGSAPQDYALYIRHQNGHATPVLCKASVYHDETGRVAGAVTTARDITERMKAKQALDIYQAELRSLSSRLTLADEHARRQLAIALHDTVGQTLALAKIKLGELGQQVTAKGTKNSVAEIREMFDKAVRQTRTLSFELSPPILYELGLDAAIEWLAEDFSKRHGFKVSLCGTTRKYKIAESVNILIFQSVRELLTNITKHAAATEVRIARRAQNGQVLMKIKDNGRGMEQREPEDAINEKNSLGLFSIRERMKHIGGTFEIQSSQGHGTTAILMVPMREQTGTVTSSDDEDIFSQLSRDE